MDDPYSAPDGDEPEVDDYGDIGVSISWGGLSVACFVLILGVHALGRGLFGLDDDQVTTATRVLAGAGLLLGLLGLKLGENSKSAKIGTVLNGLVVLFLVLILLVKYWMGQRFKAPVPPTRPGLHTSRPGSGIEEAHERSAFRT